MEWVEGMTYKLANPLQDVKFLEVNDEELLATITYLYESINRKKEKKASDAELQKLKKAVKDYEDRHYNIDIKLWEKQLTSARNQVYLRGLKINPP